ncbi:Uncharacterized 2Fe-2 and 4Fe-4S clusters-containing protein, contains DUF4445 domain [Desulfatibacillum alkenivorans DSM 16219]|uniref:Uncharacterized 2Fe-2 and 4Fe-4S clusters-containing protein, contains DUF4445 domain n=1 Tax=Desulfatibacillum alkenivorans DSM 16219 TaxID=1121393 RepID=A0A1M6F383_9BACT|nr:ASKHA domain-containing protein [Desulfatibacillum alkenivorans]SHI92142.1 Uncharacterized 2Fe-2 and 4Fe-4S clusters-containing protein, contains DUF4445 domain [Desulfatibacillum alkenivorans DSM 16219]
MSTANSNTEPGAHTKSAWVQTVEIPAPSLENNTAFVERVCSQLEKTMDGMKISVDLEVLKALPKILRTGEGAMDCMLFGQGGEAALVGVAPKKAGPLPGLAVDLGTTRVVLRLVDMRTGQILKESSFDNPQGRIGPDVLARIHYAEQEGGLEELQSLIAQGISQEGARLAAACGLSPKDVYCVAAAGNTAMTHLLLGADPYWIIREPYTPMVNSPGFLKCRDIGLDFAKSARVYVFPNVGSYFGGDLLAGILSSDMVCKEDVSMLVDVGTNAEVVVGNKDWLMACAGAAGPALEGGVTAMGMLAGPGAIEKVRIDPQTREFAFQTIGGIKPVGICGSGVIDLAAQLFLAGMIDLRGKLVPTACEGRLIELDEIPALIIVSEEDSANGRALLFSQADLDSLVRSKAAMYTILRTITNTVGLAFTDLAEFNIAGTFGSYIDPVSAITIGMIPDLPLSTYKALGNTSLEGATQVLLQREAVGFVREIREKITYMELNVNQEFMNRFSAAKFIPHTNPALFPSVKIPQ